MRTKALGLAALALAHCAAPGRADDAWKSFTSKEGRFSVLMPGKPQQQKQAARAGEKSIEVHIFSAAPAVDRIVYVTYTDHPKADVEGKEEAFVEGTSKGNVATFKGKLVSDRKLTLGKGKHPGRDILVEMPDKKQQYRARIVLAGNRLYQVVAMGSAEFVKGKQADEYFESFKLDE